MGAVRIGIGALGLAALVGCSGESQKPCPATCDPGHFFVNIPLDRVAKVSEIRTTGACGDNGEDTPYSAAFDPPTESIKIDINVVGTCHVRVMFFDGVPPYVTDVPVTLRGGPCCSDGRVANDVHVPEGDAG